MKQWVWYEVRDRKNRVRFQSLSKIDAEFFARKLIQKGESPPEITEIDRMDRDQYAGPEAA